MGKSCRFTPTCSEYAKIALKNYGFFEASVLICKRILKCRPDGGFGYDPVPLPAQSEKERKNGSKKRK